MCFKSSCNDLARYLEREVAGVSVAACMVCLNHYKNF